jgi:hypothetical protein
LVAWMFWSHLMCVRCSLATILKQGWQSPVVQETWVQKSVTLKFSFLLYKRRVVTLTLLKRGRGVMLSEAQLSEVGLAPV